MSSLFTVTKLSLVQNPFKSQIQNMSNKKSFEKLKQKCSGSAKNGIGNYGVEDTTL